MKKVIIIGAGASGLIAAGTAAKLGNRVLLIEKNERPAKKLLITGKGRCNITSAASDIRELISNIPCNGRFLFSSFSRFSNLDIIYFFEELGLKVKTERGDRVFPESDKALDVVEALRKYNFDNNVDVMFNSPVERIKTDDERVTAVVLKNGKTIECDAAILCTGGKSYSKTGSNGDGYKMAKALGHSVTELKPSLVPMVVYETWVKDLEGLSLRNIGIKIKNNKNKIIFEDFGEMVFTSFGVSGPVILSGSSHILDEKIDGMILSIDLKPALDESKLDDRILRDFSQNSRKCFKNSLDDLLPQKLIPVFVEQSGIEPMKHVHQINKEERKKIVELLKDFKFTISGLRPIEEAIITRGGISVGEINPVTMESKLVKNLFFAGEVIDVDGYTGGFNLTIAFSTGYIAGCNV